MASPKLEVFTIYDPVTGAPQSGLTPTFASYVDDTGVAVTPPTIAEVGATGTYKFTPTLPASPARGLVYVVATGGAPAFYGRYVRQEDWATDGVLDLVDEALGKWQIQVTGPDAFRLILYRQDGTTVLKKFDLKDVAGNPTVTSPFSRVPV